MLLTEPSLLSRGTLPSLRHGTFFDSLTPVSFSESLCVLKCLGQAAGARFGTSIIKDAEQVHSPSRRRHTFPSFPCAGITRECDLKNGWQVAFSVHSGE